ncbi:TIR domain-containing protein [Sphingorhabdus arenilitoris]|uniref:TIR domain-containing protein n=1 Tax=Sphingorhabdus arenilitoris TaxID=1490041 RepID=A0ABV8RFT2_9SPHN
MIRDAPKDTTDGDAETTVFFSYSRDDQARALPIINLIEQAGYKLWWDGLLGGGERFSDSTEQALERAKAVIVLWSKISVKSHWVHDEATRGRDRRILVPLSLDGSPPPLGFGQFQVIDISHAKISPSDINIRRMLDAVAILHGEDCPRIANLTTHKTGSFNRRYLMVAGGTVAALSMGAVAAWQTGLLGGSSLNDRIAVLPFTNIGGDPAQSYISEGLSTEIRSALAQNGAIQVLGQASSEAFERGKQDVISFAKKLKVGFILDGSVQVTNNFINVTIELIHGTNGIAALSRKFMKPLDDILAVQREISGSVTAELTTQIADGKASNPVIGGTSNAVAYDHYLRGKEFYTHGQSEADARNAIQQFDAAIAAEPKFASAHAARARALIAAAGEYGSASEINNYSRAAKISAQRAIQLAPRLAEAHSALALILFQGDFDARAARKYFDSSRELGDGQAPVLARFAAFCAATRRDEDALNAVNRALILDPLNALIHRIAGEVDYAAHRYDRAIQHFRETIKLNPNLPDSHARIGWIFLVQNNPSGALQHFEADAHKWTRSAGIAIAQNKLGNNAAAQKAMSVLVDDVDTVSFYQQGQVLAQWGDLDGAIAVLELALKQKDAGLLAAAFDPMLDPLRKMPPFIRLLNSMGLA